MSTDLATNTTMNIYEPTLTPAGDYYPWWQYPAYPYPTYQPVPIYYSVWPVTYQIARPRCAWCQDTHEDKCPRLKSVTYRDDGTVERVEFFKE